MRVGSFGFVTWIASRCGAEAVNGSFWLAIEALLVAFPLNALMDLT